MIREGIMISGRYEISGRIGTGGMADVYRAIDRKLNRYVAMKVLKREFREDENFVNKFQTEAQSAAGLQHPNIVSVYDVGEDRGLYYIVMELIEGITLKDYIQKKGRLTPKEVVSISVQVCSAMEMAHSRNIIHRDIKPQNIMISREGKVKVTDFGIAKATSSNTISTNAMGSVHYTSPEQARGGFSDAKSDIYSLGITMYEMITGRLPFDGDSTVSIALKHLQEDIVPPSELVPKIPYSLEQIIMKCTQKSPDRRYAEIAYLEKDLRRSLAEPDGDFVVIAPFSGSATRTITPEELDIIKSGYENDYTYDDDEDDDDYEVRRARRREANKEDVDPKMTKVMKILAIVAAVILVIVGIIFLGITIGNMSDGPGNEPQTNTKDEKVVVPKLLGMTLEEAEAECEELGLEIVVKDKVESKKYEEGQIDSQRTQPGVKLPKGAIIQVVISTGKLVEIPKLEGKTEKDATKALMKLGFEYDKIDVKEEPHEEIEEGKVTRTDPAANEWLTKNGKITIYISSGIKMVKMPNLIGLTKDEAEDALKEQGLVGNVTEEYNDSTAKGKVFDQSVDYGDELKSGTTVDYVISKGPKPVEMVKIPTGLAGKTVSEVKATLSNKGLEVILRTDTTSDKSKDIVVFVEGEGEEVEKGSTVVVVIGSK